VALVARPNIHVTLKYESRTAKAVALAGDVNQWSPAPMTKAGGEWSARLTVPNDGRFEYKFVVDGKWILDPANPKRCDNGLGGENSAWEGPMYHRTPYPDAAPRHPLARKELSAGGRKFVVYAPESSAGLPIMLYADGETYDRLGHIANVYENLTESGRIHPVVLVLVPPANRMAEYGSGYAAYADLLFKHILPAVRKSTGASGRAPDLYLGGSSLGGVIALRLAEAYPNQISGGIQSQSGAFQYAPAGAAWQSLTTRQALGKIPKSTKLWFDWGTLEGDLTKSNEALTEVLREMHRVHGSRTTGEGHNWTAWRNRMIFGITYLFSR